MSANLNKAQQGQIKSIMGDARWDSVIRFMALKLDQWRSEAINGSSAFEELRSLHKRDGKVEGVVELFDQMERQAFEV
jgi:hypothetical protein